MLPEFSFFFSGSFVEQLSDSGVSQSKKLLDLAETSRELKRTKEALEHAERIVFEQRQEGMYSGETP